MAELVELGFQYEGLRETLQALKVVQNDLYLAVLDGLNASGRIILDDARQRFIQWGTGGVASSASRGRTIDKAAEGFQVFVRPNTSYLPVLSVGQSLRRSGDMPKRRQNFGSLFMTKALLPARSEKMPAVLESIDANVTTLLRANGF